jgi:hypothetical protein
MTSRRAAWGPLALAAGMAVGCAGSVAEDLPPGWMDARPLEVHQSACGASADAGGGQPRLVLGKTANGLTGRYLDAAFRCNQHLCGFVLDARETTRVLVQPCELHPPTVTRCDCFYDVSFDLPARAGRTTVELFRRRDLYGADAPIDATIVDRQGAPY